MQLLLKLNALCRRFWNFAGMLMALLVVLLIIAATYTTLKGLPREFQNFIRNQLAEIGIMADWDYMGFDAGGRIVLKNFRCFDVIPGQNSKITVLKSALDISWPAILRGGSLIRGIVIRDASIKFTNEDGGVYGLDSLDADLVLREGLIVFEQFIITAGGARMVIQGALPTAFFQPSHPEDAQPVLRAGSDTASDDDKKNGIWQNYAEKIFKTARNSRLDVFVVLAPRPGKSWSALEASVTLHSEGGVFDNVHWNFASAKITWDGSTASIQKFALGTPQGNLTLSGSWDVFTNDFSLKLHSDTPPDSLVFLLPATFSDRLREVHTQGQFELHIEASGNLRDPSTILAHASLQWENIFVARQQVRSVQIRADFSKNRLAARDIILQTTEHQLRATISSQNLAEGLDIHLAGEINPGLFGPLIPENKAFFDSTNFLSALRLDCSAQVRFGQQPGLRLSGDASIGPLIYKGVELRGLSSRFVLTPPLLRLEQVVLERPEGRGTAVAVDYDYAAPNLRLTGVRAQFNTIPTARIFGPKLEEYLAPYRFSTPPFFQVEGFVDLVTGNDTDLKIYAEGENFTYHLLGRDTPAEKISANISMKGPNLTIEALKARVDDGDLDLEGAFRFQENSTRYELRFALRNANLQRVMKGFFDLNDVTGNVTGGANIRGRLEDLRSIRGEGEVTIREGSLIDIPFLGALSEVVGLIELGKARASEADATFRLRDGNIITNDLNIRSLTMVLIGEGRYDYVLDEMLLDVRLNIRGPAGLLLFPVSKLFEYRGTGPLANTRWEPRLFTPAVPLPQSGVAPPLRGRNR